MDGTTNNPELIYRTAEFNSSTINTEARTVELSFSSELPYLRKDGWEVISHRENDADFSFISSGQAPLLLSHDHNTQIGVVQSAGIVDGRGVATVKFSRSALGQEIFQDVLDSVRTGISVGYSSSNRTLEGKIDGQNVYRYSWKPFEISVVSIAADPTVGVGRSIEVINEINEPQEVVNLTNKKEFKMQEELNIDIIDNKIEETRDAEIITKATRAAKVADVEALCARYGFESEVAELVRSEKTLQEVKDHIVELWGKRASESKIEQGRAPAIHTNTQERTFDIGKAFKAATRQDWRGAEYEWDENQKRADQSNGLLRADRNIVILDPNAKVRATQAGPVTAGTSGTGGSLVATNYHPERLVDALWNKTFLNKLGVDEMLGLVGNASFPVISSNATTSWAAETGALPAAQGLATALKQVSPHSMVAKFSATRQSLIQDVPNVQSKILDQLYQAIAQALDAAVLNGATPALSTTGLLNEIPVGQQSVQGTNGLAPSLAALTKLRKLAVNNKIDVDQMKWLISSSMRETLSTTLKDSGNTNSGYILAEGGQTFAQLPFVSSQNVPAGVTKGTSTAGSNGGVSNVILGKWDDLLVSQWGNIAVEFDYVTGADNSLVNIRAFSFWDIIIKRLESFYMVPDFIG